MPTYDSSNAECLVFTYKEGLLSKVAHDLKLRVTRFSLEITEDAVHATFDPRSFEVVCAMERGRENPGALSESDKRQVIENMERDVLHTPRFREIVFSSNDVERDDDEWLIHGRLVLHGVEKGLSVTAEPDGDDLVARVRLRQPDFGIVPYTALLGALKIKPEIDVVIRVPQAD